MPFLVSYCTWPRTSFSFIPETSIPCLILVLLVIGVDEGGSATACGSVTTVVVTVEGVGAGEGDTLFLLPFGRPLFLGGEGGA